ncbi:MAG: hypothetical protein ACYCTZ_04140 [Candidatus Dormibacteria bacterium]
MDPKGCESGMLDYQPTLLEAVRANTGLVACEVQLGVGTPDAARPYDPSAAMVAVTVKSITDLEPVWPGFVSLCLDRIADQVDVAGVTLPNPLEDMLNWGRSDPRPGKPCGWAGYAKAMALDWFDRFSHEPVSSIARVRLHAALAIVGAFGVPGFVITGALGVAEGVGGREDGAFVRKEEAAELDEALIVAMTRLPRAV